MNIIELRGCKPGAYIVSGGEVSHAKIAQEISNVLDNKRTWYRNLSPNPMNFLLSESKNWKVGDNIILSGDFSVEDLKDEFTNLAKEEGVQIFITKGSGFNENNSSIITSLF